MNPDPKKDQQSQDPLSRAVDQAIGARSADPAKDRAPEAPRADGPASPSPSRDQPGPSDAEREAASAKREASPAADDKQPAAGPKPEHGPPDRMGIEITRITGLAPQATSGPGAWERASGGLRNALGDFVSRLWGESSPASPDQAIEPDKGRDR
jgi:hypothetical protein